MAKKKIRVTIFELVWYILCAAVGVWGLTYCGLSLIAKYGNVRVLKNFNTNFEKLFGLNLYFWGLLIVAIAVLAAVVVLLSFAKKFDRAIEREQRRSARLSALKKKSVVVDEQPAIEVEPATESNEAKAE